MRQRHAFGILLGALLLSSQSGGATELPRAAALGIRMAPPPPGSQGVLVEDVLPGLTGASLGLRQGDIIISIGGQAASGPASVIGYAAGLREKHPVKMVVRRDGRDLQLQGAAAARPFESWSGASADYGEVPFQGGHLRDIFVAPQGVERPPVLFLLQGFSCGSVEPPVPTHPYRRLGEEMVKRGIAYYRVEKPGLGDSHGTPGCTSIDFATELDSFRSAYRHLVETRGVEPDRIFMFGHSLGGMQAPLLASELPPRGVAVYGTVLKSWADYHLDISRIQSFLSSGEDPAQTFARAEQDRELVRRFYFGREAPAALAAEKPEQAARLRSLFNWDGGEMLFGRHYKFMQDLAHLPLGAAWRATRSNVLAIYGGSDIIAINEEDHQLIADIADFFRPGSGLYVEIAGTDHGMTLVGNRGEFRQKMIAAGRPPEGAFNAAVGEVLADWIKASMARPPVRTQPEPQRPSATAG